MNQIQIKNSTFPILVAVEKEELSKGLMHHSWPPPAMLFIYPEPGIRSFWMKNTPSPLDILFCNDYTIQEIRRGIPNSEKIINSKYPCDMVLELPFGTCKNKNISLNDEFKVMFDIITLAKVFETSALSK